MMIYGVKCLFKIYIERAKVLRLLSLFSCKSVVYLKIVSMVE